MLVWSIPRKRQAGSFSFGVGIEFQRARTAEFGGEVVRHGDGLVQRRMVGVLAARQAVNDRVGIAVVKKAAERRRVTWPFASMGGNTRCMVDSQR